jgi:uridine phosphorylase
MDDCPGQDVPAIPVADTVPLLEFDPGRSAFLEPSLNQSAVDGAPLAAVACFFPEVVQALANAGRPIMNLPSREPLWEIEYADQRLALFYPGVGAPLASYTLELVIAAGCRAIVACGGAGAMRPGLPMGHHVITVTAAIRDEGTSYHYIPPARWIAADPEAAALLSAVVTERGLPHLAGLTWTTDGIFRETPSRIARRRDEGCLTVEMEAAALLAVTSFRGVKFGQYLYAGDDLSGPTWDERGWGRASAVRHRLLELAAEGALALARGFQVNA